MCYFRNKNVQFKENSNLLEADTFTTCIYFINIFLSHCFLDFPAVYSSNYSVNVA